MEGNGREKEDEKKNIKGKLKKKKKRMEQRKHSDGKMYEWRKSENSEKNKGAKMEEKEQKIGQRFMRAIALQIWFGLTCLFLYFGEIMVKILFSFFEKIFSQKYEIFWQKFSENYFPKL